MLRERGREAVGAHRFAVAALRSGLLRWLDVASRFAVCTRVDGLQFIRLRVGDLVRAGIDAGGRSTEVGSGCATACAADMAVRRGISQDLSNR